MTTHEVGALETMGTSRTIPALLLTNEAAAGDTLALVTDAGQITYAELAAAARRLAAGLLASDVRPGDRVAVWLPNGVEWLVVHWAAALMGAILVPLSTRNRPAEVEYILRQSGAAALILQDRFLHTDYLAALPAILAGGLTELRTVIVRQTDGHDVGVENAALPPLAISWTATLDRGANVALDAVAAAAAAVTPDDVHVLQYTSGTTGWPKGAMLTHDGLIRSASFHAASWGLRAGDAILVPNPMSHIIGLVYAVLLPAIARVIPISVATFDAEQVLQLVQRYRPVVLLGTPTHFQMLAEHARLGDYDISSLRIGMAGGAASTPETVRRITERLGLQALVNGLGMSEAGSVAHTDPSDPPEVHATTVGRPMPWLEVRLIDQATGNEAPAGQPGELWIRGPGVMKGYFRDPEATAQALTADGWLRTGDLLALGDDGCLRFVGRVKEMFTVGGFNVYPAEVERVLVQHPAVAECQVVGVPDVRLGAVPFVFVRFHPYWSASDEELRAYCTDRLANYKVPRYFHRIEAFPLTGTGKREQRTLVEMAQAIVAAVGAKGA
ncbi:MAG TPA: AMP-binding protein [Ktedonobacterales bacterium]|nr:AMP-binding protein [Ktedonobacterales bacterium]